MYRYETHLHTFPVSACARAGVRETLLCYLEMGYDGVFITNHFLDGNINIKCTASYEEKLDFYFSDYETALRDGKELGIKVFLGIEMSYQGTDFLVYGLDRAWYSAHPEIMEMKTTEKLAYLAENGAFIVHAHPFREAWYIDHIRLFPRSVHAIEAINANRTDFENNMAHAYAASYGLPEVAGTDNHAGRHQGVFAGIMTEVPIESEQDYIQMIRAGAFRLFHESSPLQS